ncbi:uncharacterized protein LOC141809654 [Halichoeres trimaculatus]|uniref:uncharacterized protein LOC141809654 n=1 Tax=Halichoeres trimaculatus TaxID=147232 RepID=UPI003D9ECBC8
MTPWESVIFLLVTVVLSLNCSSAQEGCDPYYFSWLHYREHFNAFLPLVVASNFKDSMECTAERECLKEKSINKTHLIVLLMCFERNDSSFAKDECTETPKCRALESNRNISYYHFLCLTAEALEVDTTENSLDCAYDYYNHIRNLPRVDQTTIQPLPLTTTVKTTTVKATTVKTTTPTLPETTTAAPAMSQPGSQPTTTSGRAHLQSMLQNANSSSTSEKVEANQQPVLSLVTVLLVVSVILLVMSCLYIIHLRWQLNIRTAGLVLTPIEVQPAAEIESNTQMESANGGVVESSHLLQPDCVIINTAKQDNHE